MSSSGDPSGCQSNNQNTLSSPGENVESGSQANSHSPAAGLTPMEVYLNDCFQKRRFVLKGPVRPTVYLLPASARLVLSSLPSSGTNKPETVNCRPAAEHATQPCHGSGSDISQSKAARSDPGIPMPRAVLNIPLVRGQLGHDSTNKPQAAQDTSTLKNTPSYACSNAVTGSIIRVANIPIKRVCIKASSDATAGRPSTQGTMPYLPTFVLSASKQEFPVFYRHFPGNPPVSSQRIQLIAQPVPREEDKGSSSLAPRQNEEGKHAVEVQSGIIIKKETGTDETSKCTGGTANNGDQMAHLTVDTQHIHNRTATLKPEGMDENSVTMKQSWSLELLKTEGAGCSAVGQNTTSVTPTVVGADISKIKTMSSSQNEGDTVRYINKNPSFLLRMQNRAAATREKPRGKSKAKTSRSDSGIERTTKLKPKRSRSGGGVSLSTDTETTGPVRPEQPQQTLSKSAPSLMTGITPELGSHDERTHPPTLPRRVVPTEGATCADRPSRAGMDCSQTLPPAGRRKTSACDYRKHSRRNKEGSLNEDSRSVHSKQRCAGSQASKQDLTGDESAFGQCSTVSILSPHSLEMTSPRAPDNFSSHQRSLSQPSTTTAPMDTERERDDDATFKTTKRCTPLPETPTKAIPVKLPATPRDECCSSSDQIPCDVEPVGQSLNRNPKSSAESCEARHGKRKADVLKRSTTECSSKGDTVNDESSGTDKTAQHSREKRVAHLPHTSSQSQTVHASSSTTTGEDKGALRPTISRGFLVSDHDKDVRFREEFAAGHRLNEDSSQDEHDSRRHGPQSSPSHARRQISSRTSANLGETLPRQESCSGSHSSCSQTHSIETFSECHVYESESHRNQRSSPLQPRRFTAQAKKSHVNTKCAKMWRLLRTVVMFCASRSKTSWIAKDRTRNPSGSYSHDDLTVPKCRRLGIEACTSTRVPESDAVDATDSARNNTSLEHSSVKQSIKSRVTRRSSPNSSGTSMSKSGHSPESDQISSCFGMKTQKSDIPIKRVSREDHGLSTYTMPIKLRTTANDENTSSHRLHSAVKANAASKSLDLDRDKLPTLDGPGDSTNILNGQPQGILRGKLPTKCVDDGGDAYIHKNDAITAGDGAKSSRFKDAALRSPSAGRAAGNKTSVPLSHLPSLTTKQDSQWRPLRRRLTTVRSESNKEMLLRRLTTCKDEDSGRDMQQPLVRRAALPTPTGLPSYQPFVRFLNSDDDDFASLQNKPKPSMCALPSEHLNMPLAVKREVFDLEAGKRLRNSKYEGLAFERSRDGLFDTASIGFHFSQTHLTNVQIFAMHSFGRSEQPQAAANNASTDRGTPSQTPGPSQAQGNTSLTDPSQNCSDALSSDEGTDSCQNSKMSELTSSDLEDTATASTSSDPQRCGGGSNRTTSVMALWRVVHNADRRSRPRKQKRSGNSGSRCSEQRTKRSHTEPGTPQLRQVEVDRLNPPVVHDSCHGTVKGPRDQDMSLSQGIPRSLQVRPTSIPRGIKKSCNSSVNTDLFSRAFPPETPTRKAVDRGCVSHRSRQFNKDQSCPRRPLHGLPVIASATASVHKLAAENISNSSKGFPYRKQRASTTNSSQSSVDVKESTTDETTSSLQPGNQTHSNAYSSAQMNSTESTESEELPLRRHSSQHRQSTGTTRHQTPPNSGSLRKGNSGRKDASIASKQDESSDAASAQDAPRKRKRSHESPPALSLTSRGDKTRRTTAEVAASVESASGMDRLLVSPYLDRCSCSPRNPERDDEGPCTSSGVKRRWAHEGHDNDVKVKRRKLHVSPEESGKSSRTKIEGGQSVDEASLRDVCQCSDERSQHADGLSTSKRGEKSSKGAARSLRNDLHLVRSKESKNASMAEKSASVEKPSWSVPFLNDNYNMPGGTHYPECGTSKGSQGAVEDLVLSRPGRADCVFWVAGEDDGDAETLDFFKGSSRPTDCVNPSPESAMLAGMRHIIFLDLENWGNFFYKLPQRLPDLTYVWAFKSWKTNWFTPDRSCHAYHYMRNKGWFSLTGGSSSGKNAADFTIFFMVGQMDGVLPKSIPFTVLSGDAAFRDLELLLELSERRSVVINPHDAQRVSPDMLYTMIVSVADY